MDSSLDIRIIAVSPMNVALLKAECVKYFLDVLA